jgi:hypothetical protein
MLKIEPMSLLEVRQAWGWVRNGLLTVIEKCRERYEPEDVWTAVMAGQSHIWRIEFKQDDIGFAVLRRDMDPDGPVLFLWCLWAEPGSLMRHRKQLYDRMKELARRIGARRMRFESPLNGWLGMSEYFDAVKTTFESEV